MAIDELRVRVPPGQRWIKTFPVLDLGIRPRFDEHAWRFPVGGLVTEPRSYTFAEFCALPRVEQVSDFHCVTGWSRIGDHWSGIRFAEVIGPAGPAPAARFAFIECADAYTTSLPLEDALGEDVLFALEHEREPVTSDHGGPVRLIVPKLYAYKAAKWPISITLLEEDKLGYWESRGYSNTANPWTEDRRAGK